MVKKLAKAQMGKIVKKAISTVAKEIKPLVRGESLAEKRAAKDLFIQQSKDVRKAMKDPAMKKQIQGPKQVMTASEKREAAYAKAVEDSYKKRGGQTKSKKK